MQVLLKLENGMGHDLSGVKWEFDNANQVSELQWECDVENLSLLESEVNDLLCESYDNPNLAVFGRRLMGAIRAAISAPDKADGWVKPRYPELVYQGNLRAPVKMYRILICANGADGYDVQFRMEDGTVVMIPNMSQICWSPMLTNKLNEISYLGGGWEDKNSGSAMDHLFSHGH